MPNKKLESNELVMKAAVTPSSDGNDHEREGPADDEPQQPGAVRPEGDAQAELGRPLRDGIVDDTVNADSRQEQREPAEACGQQRQQPFVDERLITPPRRAS